VIWRNMLPPSSSSKSKPSKKPSMKQAASFLPASCLVSCLAYSLNLKMEVIHFSKTLVHFHQSKWHYIPEDRTLHI
jgi:hypothetical protein